MNTLVNRKAKMSFILVKAEWCGHCRNFKPVYSEISDKYPNVNFLMIDYDENANVFAQFNEIVYSRVPEIKTFPTIFIYDKKGEYVKVVADREKLEDEIKKFY